jgi:hypothetical protein
MANDKLVGAWKLVSAKYQAANSAAKEIYGANPLGLLIYNPNGKMAIQIFRVDRPRFAANDRLAGMPAETKAAFDGMLAYFGAYTVDEQKQTVTHHLAGAWFPNWVGTNQTRFFELTENRLILRTPPLDIDGAQMIGQLVWERVG